MKHSILPFIVAGLFGSVGIGRSDDATSYRSGPRPGKKLSQYVFTKLAGGEGDRLKAGKGRCISAYMRARPAVIIFARKESKPLANLLRALDERMKQSDERQFVTVVNLFQQYGRKLNNAVESHSEAIELLKPKYATLVFPKGHSHRNILQRYSAPADDRITVILASGKRTTVWSKALKPDDLDKLAIDNIMRRLDQHLSKQPAKTSNLK